MNDEPNRDGLEIKSEEKKVLGKDELEEFNFEEWEGTEEDKSNPTVTILTFAGLVIVAAIICAILWHFTHLDKETKADGEAESSIAVTEEATLEDEYSNEPVPEESVSVENSEELVTESAIRGK